jgi:uncharacterized protein (TIGR02270 family)
MRLPDFAASDATRRFSADLHREHLEEASFLYDQRRSLQDDPEVTWLDVEAFEKRLDAHLDAMVSADAAAFEVCASHAKDGEPGAVYAAVCVFCRTGRRDLLGVVLKNLDAEKAPSAEALSDAMKDEMPAEWGDALVPALAQGYAKLIPMLAHYWGYRRLAAARALDRLIGGLSAKDLAEGIWALGRTGADFASVRLADYVRHEDATVRTNAVMALLRRADDSVIAVCRDRALRGDEQMCLPLAVSGGRSDAAALEKSGVAQTPEGLLALGMLGDLGSVRFLIDRLTDERLGAAAATALQLITGANLREEVFVPEAVEEGELFEDERQVFRKTGEGPKHPDGRAFGTNVKRTSREPDDWRDWLEEHKGNFDAKQRYRLGRPFSLSTLVDTLVSPSFGPQVRSMAYEELVIRYGIDVRFETEMRVKEQKKQINAIARQCRSSEASFHPGEWYFAKSPA